MPFPEIKINGQPIGENQPTYIIAEIGINHNGDFKEAQKLIEAAKDAGADAVKFQKRDLKSLYPPEVLDHPEKFEQNFQYMIPLLKEVELSKQQMEQLKLFCDTLGITFLCTPFDVPSALFLNELGLPGFKTASADLTNLDLLEQLIAFKKPLILSTGMSAWEEIEQVVSLLKEARAQFALLHCRSVYPVWPREVNLRMINKLKQFDCPVGYSGHEIGIIIPLAAASMGASIIEKHITLDKSLPGPDHKASLEPFEFKRMVRDIHIADQATGKPNRYMLRGEVLNRELFGKSLVATQDISPGTIISEKMIGCKGPGKGLSPLKKKKLIGLPAKRQIMAGGFFKETDIEANGAVVNFSHTFRSSWGLIARFTDIETIAAHQPQVIEFHLAEKDFNLPHNLNRQYDCRLVLHAPEYMGDTLHDLCSLSENTREQSVQQTIRAVELMRSIQGYFNGRPKFITHPGAMSLNQKLNKRQLAENLARSVDEIRKATAGDYEFLLENLPPYPWYFGGQWKGNYFMDAEEIVEFCTTLGVGLCFDLSHAALYCNAKNIHLADYIKKILPITRHIHFADGYGLDGEGMQIGEGDVDMDAILPLFSHYSESWVPEVWRGHLDDGQGFLVALKRLAQYDL